ncbi:FAD-dependent oxidoreductase [Oleiphilus sp. HI0118]|uniref:NAD(P)/FAD-dependent oxidoreductase n=2 Tax=Oleiphilus sp. HI0079 TaxID=1822254 RepID=UPI0007C2B8D2|nr:FAD-dependent oxidoreductase [Oleiphilus sp. HI0079]KZY92597.1 FAD-dependent oxidoreductase [Oleiphilus sp. HI0073]KZZ13278.1 FAD-dependent oxidoreductase [Oleiphilus sp. HI0079]KZZ44578.1 FAD-dependent oxidoreductase [Oleiphilus sp. HI0118]KZZ75747.1 FAD-dependent oxidoreductase [Oleiphilus sp. HI0133]
MTKLEGYKTQSLWLSQLTDLSIRPSLTANHDVDVAIIGAGFTGLWTAYYLKKKSPELRVAIIEADIAGYGASGRNGGWLIGELSEQDSYLEDLWPPDKERARTLLHAIPHEAQRVIQEENIACDFKLGGMLYVAARYPEQKHFLQAYERELRQKGYTDADFKWLDAQQTGEKIGMANASGALYSPHCARIQPAKLVTGLAAACERLGVEIFEQSPATEWGDGNVVLANGHRIACQWVVPALEAYGVSIEKAPFSWMRYQRPVQSAIIATEPLSEALWQEMGLHHGEVFSDFSRIVTYGQRSADNRFVFGARGSYLFGAALKHDARLSESEIAFRRNLLQTLFPQLEGVKVTHAWGGNLAISRKFRPHMLLNREHGFALSAGYGGEGVGATNLAGRTLSDMILGVDSPETQMPWVDHSGTFANSKRWEREPLPWLGYRALTSISLYEDKLLSAGKADTARRKFADTVYRLLERKMA